MPEEQSQSQEGKEEQEKTRSRREKRVFADRAFLDKSPYSEQIYDSWSHLQAPYSWIGELFTLTPMNSLHTIDCTYLRFRIVCPHDM